MRAHDNAALWLQLGDLLVTRNRLAEAAVCYQEALTYRPDDANMLNNLGTVRLRQGRLEEAAACYRQALARDPAHAQAVFNLAGVLGRQGRLTEAVARYRQAIALKQDWPAAHNNLATIHVLLYQPAEAIACLAEAVRQQPHYPEAHSNLATAHAQLCLFQAAADHARTAVRQAPDFAEAHCNLGHALLAMGELAEGWRECEWRWQVASWPRAHAVRQRQWRGEPAAGRTLLVHAEQGLGDMLQFCRYVPLAHERGLRVIVEAPAPLVRLLHGLRGVAHVVTSGADLPLFDLHCPMLSLPLAFGTTLGSVPGETPYLFADTAEAAAWRARLAPAASNGPRVGLAWAGNPRPDWAMGASIDQRRSLPPERLGPLLAVPGIQFVSVQKGGPRAPAGFALDDPMDAMHDFADTAALVANLDLVITVDSAMAHLAGALGRPVWMLDRFDHCWRWLAGRRDSPWYPTMRIYRQPMPGDWESVLTEMAQDLGSLAIAWRQAWAGTHPARLEA